MYIRNSVVVVVVVAAAAAAAEQFGAAISAILYSRSGFSGFLSF
jgi:hypothetical protein